MLKPCCKARRQSTVSVKRLIQVLVFAHQSVSDGTISKDQNITVRFAEKFNDGT